MNRPARAEVPVPGDTEADDVEHRRPPRVVAHEHRGRLGDVLQPSDLEAEVAPIAERPTEDGEGAFDRLRIVGPRVSPPPRALGMEHPENGCFLLFYHVVGHFDPASPASNLTHFRGFSGHRT